jgi:hypothetical protein
MEQKVAQSRGGCNSKRDLLGSEEITSMVFIYIEDGNTNIAIHEVFG